jgi:hypothetical protein
LVGVGGVGSEQHNPLKIKRKGNNRFIVFPDDKKKEICCQNTITHSTMQY